jgi:hypothetical protein
VGRLEVVHLDELRSPEKKAERSCRRAASSSRITAEAQIQHIQEPMWPHWCCCWFQGIHRCGPDDFAGALRAGAGLVEVFVPEEIYEIVASAAPMESMVKPLRSYRDLLKEKPTSGQSDQVLENPALQKFWN